MRTALVVFGPDVPDMRDEELVCARDYIDPGSIYDASAFLEELSKLEMTDGKRITKACTYQEYELWWINYNSLFHYFCRPYFEYRRLLSHLSLYDRVIFYDAPHEHRSLLVAYLEAYEREVIVRGRARNGHRALPFGVLLQMLLTLFSLLLLIAHPRRIMLFIGDKFEVGRDHDFRMRYIYEEMRAKKLSFVEIIRSLEPSRVVLAHAWKRRRPAIYSEAVFAAARFMSIISGDRTRARKRFTLELFPSASDPALRFRQLVAIQFLRTVGDDVWAIRLMRLTLRLAGIRAGFVAAALERNYHTVLAAKVAGIPTVGILHGVASRFYNVYDFTPAYNGEKSIGVDTYGVWSDWWREYYETYSKTYRAQQFFVSGPMRPLARPLPQSPRIGALRILFIGEQLAHFPEVIPFLSALLAAPDLAVRFKFRPYRDGFEAWLRGHHPEMLAGADVMRGTMQEAIANADVVVGSHSTAVLEALMAGKPPVFYDTKKWGDYFELRDYGANHPFFAQTPDELLRRIREAPEIRPDEIQVLRERYFGDPSKNGSAWVVDQLEELSGGS